MPKRKPAPPGPKIDWERVARLVLTSRLTCLVQANPGGIPRRTLHQHPGVGPSDHVDLEVFARIIKMPGGHTA